MGNSFADRVLARWWPLAVVLLMSLAPARGATWVAGMIDRGDFRVIYDGRGVTGLMNPRDPYQAAVLRDRPLGLTLQCRTGGAGWTDLSGAAYRMEPGADAVAYQHDDPASPLKVKQSFSTDGKALDWNIELTASAKAPVTVGDLAINIPWRRAGGDNAVDIFEQGYCKHHFISGYGSFIYFVRASGAPPFLLITTRPGTHLEYSTADRMYRAFIHSAVTGPAESRGTWRQEHTSLTLAPGQKVGYGFRFQWAWSYDQLRDLLVQERLFDVRVAPGMSVPEDLPARVALRSRANIEGLAAEFPEQTTISDLGRRGEFHLYDIRFRKLGENKITIRHDAGRQTYLEFFVTEPLETLIKKRAAFIVDHQQHRKPDKWYDGLFSVWDMKAKVLRGPDDTDGFDGWWGYVLACDDPALCKAPYVAEKNVAYPDEKEIAAVEYYLEHFVWGKLQRTDKELPYPYGIYGTPNWKVARDVTERAKLANHSNLDKMHVWRAYDYPHITMLYFHMYQVAKKYPELTHYLDARGYLERAYQTAHAFFLYPYEILPYYTIYQTGYYNELLILPLAEALEQEGFADRAKFLRSEWEKKVKYFVYDHPYPFGSEYAFDRTAYESSYALAKYGVLTKMEPDTNLWFDKELKKWYSHPVVRQADARAFMDRQLAAGLTVRGWIEPAYYLLGADMNGSSDRGCNSYMSAMGGWAILDYALHFAPQPYDYLQLGYNSYLASWSLMNTGRPDTNFGYWFPGPENDGAAGWTFMPAKFGRAWIRKDVARGPWHYDGEIDLGYGAALRMAATIVAQDPVFGPIAYGGTLIQKDHTFQVVPRDGLRQRLYVLLDAPAKAAPFPATVAFPKNGVLPDPTAAAPAAYIPPPPALPGRLMLQLDRDGFAQDEPITLDDDLRTLTFTVENRVEDTHTATLDLALPAHASYTLYQDGTPIALQPTKNWDYPLRAQISFPNENPVRLTLVRNPGTPDR